MPSHSGFRLTPFARKLACLLLLVLAVCCRANAQGDDRDSITSFVNSVAKTVYGLAWPTATYSKVALNDFTFVPGGCDITVKLSGISAFDDSDLWVRMVIMVRNGKVTDFKVRDHNAIIAPPFQTTKYAAQAVADMAAEYDRQHKQGRDVPPPPTPHQENLQTVEAACITNATPYTIGFQFRLGDGSWTTAKVEPNASYRMWWPYTASGQTAQQLSFRYDDDPAPGYTERIYDLDGVPAAQPVVCSQANQYAFQVSGAKVLVFHMSR